MAIGKSCSVCYWSCNAFNTIIDSNNVFCFQEASLMHGLECIHFKERSLMVLVGIKVILSSLAVLQGAVQSFFILLNCTIGRSFSSHLLDVKPLGHLWAHVIVIHCCLLLEAEIQPLLMICIPFTAVCSKQNLLFHSQLGQVMGMMCVDIDSHLGP